ncbi:MULTISPECIES: PcfJ domain-containing protein [Bacteroidales]|uniref:PcfJ domain-containing protein n=1 Tax=Bacteroidales TaxID=171549 RepID=UPI0009EC0573|nr:MULTISPECIES: PcfJ domain-containing protein [Bacteroidales]KAB4159267.1 hypothetical protein GAQ47_11980 [Bacteroides uniformis]MBA5673563.1 PcfJ domain-containing protein [Bacteroides fragilis]MBP8870984.1 PcfJ domain-containing protein [Bacteroides sp.]MBV4224841.1 PcfJ domain-containing protein [Parabacteroides distasonis]MCE8583230.1 PcfJ domain-containing protein [Bacteroides fragilis]
MRSVKYICLKDLKAEHDRWLHKVNAAEEKRRSIEKLQRAKQREDEFYKNKSCFFGIVITDNDICNDLLIIGNSQVSILRHSFFLKVLIRRNIKATATTKSMIFQRTLPSATLKNG